MSTAASPITDVDPAQVAPLQGDYRGLRILAVHAHPDDESSKGAASMAAYAERGARVLVASMTGGERGDILNPAVEANPAAHRDLPGVRRQEMRRAAQVLGIEHRWIGFVDSGLPEGDPLPPLPFGAFATLPLKQAAAPLIQLVRSFKPHVILTYDENGGYPHPDHIMTHLVSMEAFEKAGDAEAYPGTGEPWQVSKIYYDRAFNVDRMTAFHRHLEEAGLDSPFARWVAMAQEEDLEGHRPPVSRHQTTTRIASFDYFEKRDEALHAHASQVPPDSLFFAISSEVQQKIWPYEDYVLAHSRVRTDLPETCFASGIDYRA